MLTEADKKNAAYLLDIRKFTENSRENWPPDGRSQVSSEEDDDIGKFCTVCHIDLYDNSLQIEGRNVIFSQ